MIKQTFSAYYHPELEDAIKEACKDQPPYDMEFHVNSDDFKSFKAAVNQGIDSHLEAIQFTQFSGQYGRAGFAVDRETLYVLIRRLMESGDENAESLASTICETIGIELV